MGNELQLSTRQIFTPERTDQLCLHGLPLCVRQRVMANWTNDRGADGQFESEFAGYNIQPGAPKHELEVSRRAVVETCQPGDVQIIAAELQRMRALTKSRAEPSADS